MKRVFLGEVLQTIYLDISVYENSEMYIHQTKSEEMHQKTYIAKEHNLQDIMRDLEKRIHPRYTKVIIDASPDLMRSVTKMIDSKHNTYIPETKTRINEYEYKIIPEQMLEMVQVVKYAPKRLDIKEFMANKTIYVMKDVI